MIQSRQLSATERTFSRLKADWPLVIDATAASSIDALLRHCERNRTELRQQLNLHGALLFRGFDVWTTQHFQDVLGSLGIDPSPFPYAGNTLRPATGPEVFDVTSAPAWTSIFAHNEMFYWFRQPRFISFFCERSDGIEGETPVVDCRKVWKDLPSPIRDVLTEARLYVVSRYASADSGSRNPFSLGTQLANTWQAVGSTLDRGDFEASMAGEVTWARNESVKVKVENALVVAHPETGDLCFRGLAVDPLLSTVVFNRKILDRLSASARLKCAVVNRALSLISRFQTQVGVVGGSLTRAQVFEMYEVVWRHTSFFRWRAGDVLVVDNVSMGHGRLNVDGERTLHVSIGGEVTTRDLELR